MAKYIKISIIASVPDDKDELCHEAIVASKDGVNAAVEALKKLGLTNIVRTSDVIKRHPRKTAVPGEAMFRPAPAPDPATVQPDAILPYA